MLLIYVRQFDSLTDTERALVSLFQPHDKTEKRRFASAIGTNDTDDAIRR